MAFVEGDQVQLHSLAAADFNGEYAVVVGRTAARVEVVLASGVMKAIKRENLVKVALEPRCLVSPVQLVSRGDLNGKLGRLVKFEAESARWEVDCKGAGVVKVKPMNLVRRTAPTASCPGILPTDLAAFDNVLLEVLEAVSPTPDMQQEQVRCLEVVEKLASKAFAGPQAPQIFLSGLVALGVALKDTSVEMELLLPPGPVADDPRRRGMHALEKIGVAAVQEGMREAEVLGGCLKFTRSCEVDGSSIDLAVEVSVATQRPANELGTLLRSCGKYAVQSIRLVLHWAQQRGLVCSLSGCPSERCWLLLGLYALRKKQVESLRDTLAHVFTTIASLRDLAPDCGLDVARGKPTHVVADRGACVVVLDPVTSRNAAEGLTPEGWRRCLEDARCAWRLLAAAESAASARQLFDRHTIAEQQGQAWRVDLGGGFRPAALIQEARLRGAGPELRPTPEDHVTLSCRKSAGMDQRAGQEVAVEIRGLRWNRRVLCAVVSVPEIPVLGFPYITLAMANGARPSDSVAALADRAGSNWALPQPVRLRGVLSRPGTSSSKARAPKRRKVISTSFIEAPDEGDIDFSE
mmetsp:Transcript_16976/g.43271  ORF Transcript_16976/g.43271 Transcript_16976/m.43271 type:complete len:578 (+) Transcript_16976:71-1804(+)